MLIFAISIVLGNIHVLFTKCLCHFLAEVEAGSSKRLGAF